MLDWKRWGDGKGLFGSGGGWGDLGGRQIWKAILHCCSGLQKVRRSKTSAGKYIRQDGPVRNSPLQGAKHVPFSGTSARKSYVF